jgi:hypothetical protein
MCDFCLDKLVYYQEDTRIFNIFKEFHLQRNENPLYFEEKDNKNSLEYFDVIITSASRPEALEITVNSFKEFLKFSGKMRFHLHEDVLPNKSNESERLIKRAEGSGNFSTIVVSNPRVGRGTALNKLKRCMTSKYFMYTEEDLAFTRYINVDTVFNTFDAFSQINQICFPYGFPLQLDKPSPTDKRKKFRYIPKDYNGVLLCVADRFGWLPGIWRKSFIFNNWHFEKIRSNKNLNKQLKKKITNEWDYDSIEKNMGVFYYGAPDANHFKNSSVFHICEKNRNDRNYL